MNRHVVAGMLGLALAGCSLDPRSRSTLSAVELTPPLSTIHETINQENAQVDTDMVRAGHPIAARDQAPPARRAPVEPVQARSSPAVADAAPAEKSPAEGADVQLAARSEPRPARLRPAPFSRFLGKPRPRIDNEPAQTVATTPAPGAAPAGTVALATPGATGPDRPLPDPEMTAPLPPDPPSPPAETPALAEVPPGREPQAGQSSTSAAGTAAASPPSPPAETPADGRVKVQAPDDGAGVPTPGSVIPKSAGRDPLLGPDPDIMPDLNTPHPGLTPEASKDKGPSPENPAAPSLPPPELPPAPVSQAAQTPAVPGEQASPAPDTAPLADPVEAGATAADPAPVIRLTPPTDLESTPANAETPADAPSPPAGVASPSEVAAPAAASPPAAADVPTPPADPSAGPKAESGPKIETPAARAVPIPSGGGKPPTVSEITGITPPGTGDTPVPVPFDPAATPARSEIPETPRGVPATPAPIPPAASTPPPSRPPENHAAGDVPTPIPPAAALNVGRPGGERREPAPAKPVEVVPEPRATLEPGRDPLLGPDPDIMPSITLPPVKATAPGPPARATPKPLPSPNPAPKAAAPAPDPAPVPAPARPARADTKPPENVSDPVELPPLSDAGASGSIERPPLAGFASVPVSAPSEETRDPGVRQAAGQAGAVQTPMRMPEEPTAVRSKPAPRAVFEAGKPAAWVGEEVITLHELTVVFKQRRKGMAAGQELSEEMRYYMAKTVLNDMVDRALVLQEAKRDLKDAKKFQKFMELADAQFYEEEVPPLLRQSATANVHELKTKMEERDESLDELREQFRLEFLSRGYMEQKLGPKMKVDLHEMRDYYKAHLKDFDQPAQVTWREVLVEVEKSRNRSEARAKADALLARLRSGGDFAALAKAESDGPNRSDGGLWKTSPGSYSVPAVNAALESLPAGKVSPVIEGPTSYHIVMVEDRRPAGPASFAEVQDKCHHAIRRKKVNQETAAYLEKLRRRTVVRTVFDDPGVTRTSAESVSPAAPAARP